jgi:hypothetical protein
VEKFATKPPRLDEGDRSVDQARHDNSGKPGARAYIHPRSSSARFVTDELRRIDDVSFPDMLQRSGRDQVLPGVLFPQEAGVSLEPFECFTWNRPLGSLFEQLDHAAARRLAAT